MNFLPLTTMSIVALSFFNRVILVDIGVVVETIGGNVDIGAIRHDTVLAISGAILMSGGTSGLFVIMSAATPGWAGGPQPATDYAVLYGVSRLIATFAIIALSNLVAVIGWSVYYVGASFALLVAALLLWTILPDLKRHGIKASK